MEMVVDIEVARRSYEQSKAHKSDVHILERQALFVFQNKQGNQSD